MPPGDEQRMAVALTIIAIYAKQPAAVVHWVWAQSAHAVNLLHNQFGYKDWLAQGGQPEAFVTT